MTVVPPKHDWGQGRAAPFGPWAGEGDRGANQPRPRPAPTADSTGRGARIRRNCDAAPTSRAPIGQRNNIVRPTRAGPVTTSEGAVSRNPAGATTLVRVRACVRVRVRARVRALARARVRARCVCSRIAGAQSRVPPRRRGASRIGRRAWRSRRVFVRARVRVRACVREIARARVCVCGVFICVLSGGGQGRLVGWVWKNREGGGDRREGKRRVGGLRKKESKVGGRAGWEGGGWND